MQARGKIFWTFQSSIPGKKQAYKLELPKKWRIHDIFHVLLLEQDTIRKGIIAKTRHYKQEASENIHRARQG